MTSLLHIDASASHYGEFVSRQLSALFAESWRGVHGDAGYRYRDVANEPVPPVTAAYVNLGRRVERHGIVAPSEVPALIENEAEQREWDLTLPLITELLTRSKARELMR
jgi:FMN-dependent NADH-azoreductase